MSPGDSDRWNRNAACLALALISVASACAGPAGVDAGWFGKVQLAQSFPVETTLVARDLPTARDVWLQMIRDARRTIDIAQFYVSARPGEALDAVIEELARAGRRGVRIRFLVSSALVAQDQPALNRLRTIDGLELRYLDLRNATGGILHAKYWVIDGTESFVGSQNFDWRSLTHILELGARVRDRIVARDLTDVFEVDWQMAKDGRKPAGGFVCGRGEGPVEVMVFSSPRPLSPPCSSAALDELLRLIRTAGRSIRVQLLSYSAASRAGKPWPVIDNALRAAASRGVKVDLLVSDWSLEGRSQEALKALGQVRGVTVKIVTIPEWTRGFIPYARVIHSKFMVVDCAVLWLGTSNWSESYFTASRNVELVIRRPEIARAAGRVFENTWTSDYATPIDPAKKYIPPRRAERARGGLALGGTP